MVQYRKWLLSRIDEVVAFEDAPEECLEQVWERCVEIVHEAGDRAARLGLAQIVERSRQFRRRTTPGKAKALLAECLAALRQVPMAAAVAVDGSKTPPATALTVAEVAARLKITRKTVYVMCRSHTLRCYRAGRSLRVPVEEIERFESESGTRDSAPCFPDIIKRYC